MKRINILLGILSVLTIFSCSNKEVSPVSNGLEMKATERAELLAKELLTNPVKELSLHDFKTVISNDSLCIVDFKNGEAELEYVLFKFSGEMFEKMYYEGQSKLFQAKSLVIMTDIQNEDNPDMSEEDKIVNLTYYLIAKDIAENGARKIE